MTTLANRPALDILKDMVATDDPKERIRIYEAAHKSTAEQLFGNSDLFGGGFDFTDIFKGAPK